MESDAEKTEETCEECREWAAALNKLLREKLHREGGT